MLVFLFVLREFYGQKRLLKLFSFKNMFFIRLLFKCQMLKISSENRKNPIIFNYYSSIYFWDLNNRFCHKICFSQILSEVAKKYRPFLFTNHHRRYGFSYKKTKSNELFSFVLCLYYLHIRIDLQLNEIV